MSKERNKKTKRNKYMKIEIIKVDNNLVADFFSSPSNTPETDAEFDGINAFCKEDRKLNAMTSYARKLESERDEAREKAERYRLEANAMMLQRDEAREALSKIDEIFCDGEDTHDDWMKMGIIAKDYLKGLE